MTCLSPSPTPASVPQPTNGTMWLSTLFFSISLGLHLWHMEVPRLEVESELQLPAYATAYDNDGSLTHRARPGIKPASSWMLVRFGTTEPRQELPRHSCPAEISHPAYSVLWSIINNVSQTKCPWGSGCAFFLKEKNCDLSQQGRTFQGLSMQTPSFYSWIFVLSNYWITIQQVLGATWTLLKVKQHRSYV